MADLRLSVLDQAPISEGMSGAQALRNSLDLAQFTESLGYVRYWVAEHHGTPALACASPEALIGPMAASTSKIRVGSGGVMLPHYSPLKVAETFSMLSGLHPGRIDLGVGRAAGTDPRTTLALQRDRRQAAPDDFPQQLVELLAYLEDDMPPDHPFRRLTQLPGRPDTPELWLLGSSPQSGIWAAELGLPYAFADFINPNALLPQQLHAVEGTLRAAHRVLVERRPLRAPETSAAEAAAAPQEPPDVSFRGAQTPRNPLRMHDDRSVGRGSRAEARDDTFTGTR